MASPAVKNGEFFSPVPNATTPYWRSEPHPLDEFRSTSDLPSTSDIVIIGAGMTGVLMAYHLLQRHQDRSTAPSIAIIEARQVCSGATGRNGGHLKLSFPHIESLTERFGVEAATEVSNFHLRQIKAMKELVEKEDLDCELLLTRSFNVYLDESQAQETLETIKRLKKEGKVTAMEEFDIIPKRHLVKVTSVKDAKAAYSVPAASLWPYKLVTSLLQKIIDRVNLQTNTVVIQVSEHRDADGFFTIKTKDRGEIRAKTVVFATNAYTAGILPTFKDKIIPVRGINTHTSQKAGPEPIKEMANLLYTYNIHHPGGTADYMNPRPDGGITVGGGRKRFGPDPTLWYQNINDDTLVEPALDHFHGYMQRYFKGWEDSHAEVDWAWTGIMGYTADLLPHIGKIPNRQEEGQYVIAGFNGAGMLHILLSTKGLARMIDEGIAFDQTGIPSVFETTAARLADTRNLVSP